MSQSRLNPALTDTLRRLRVVPVLTVDRVETAVPLARALVAGGLIALEVTLRTDAALAAIRHIAEGVPDALVGAGTILSPDDGQRAIDAGARFLVSPGLTPQLVGAAEQWRVPFLPGAATASEVMALRDLGYRCLKFFPAEASGGVAALKGLAAPLPDMAFCPTGGIGPATMADYLAQPNVVAVGGSWVAPATAVADGDWEHITRLARAVFA
ncbi:MAG: bifunctional 4-hydroxy-2-oxoglutarate aldolase/2-dehydro-3-deoxy-phosphogluconate aldolase [Pseudomonadota bacterium]